MLQNLHGRHGSVRFGVRLALSAVGFGAASRHLSTLHPSTPTPPPPPVHLVEGGGWVVRWGGGGSVEVGRASVRFGAVPDVAVRFGAGARGSIQYSVKVLLKRP